MEDANSPAGKISDKLLYEKRKALELLEKSQSPKDGRNERVSHLFRPFRTDELASGGNSREYRFSVNLSDLATDKTVDLQDTLGKLTFDPKEITARSTMFTREKRKEVPKTAQELLEDSFEDILTTSRCQNVREMSKSYRESLAGDPAKQKYPTKRISQQELMDSFQSDEFVCSDNAKRNLLSEDEREWEKEFYTVPGMKRAQAQPEIPVDFDGLSGFMMSHNNSSVSDHFSLNAFCNKQCESIGNIIRAESPTGQIARGVLNTTVSSMASAASAASSAVGRTYTKESEEPDDIRALIENLKLSESTSKILAEHFARVAKKSGQNEPLDDITTKEQNLKTPERRADDVNRSGKENRKEEKEYQEFCRFRPSKSPRRAGSHTTLTISADSLRVDDDRRFSTRVESVGARKRSRSNGSRKVDEGPAVVECRRAKSPSNRGEMRVLDTTASPTMETTAQSDRMLLFQSPMDVGKLSLPNYGLVKGASKSPASAGLTRTTSQLSTASEFNHREGYLPLKATQGELCWGSVRLRTSATKSIQIKNTSSKKLTFRAVIDGPGFQFGSADAPQMTITLQKQECRAMWIVFCPTVKGPAAGNLIFKPPTVDDTRVNCKIPLYGYGGHASVSLEGLQQGLVGSKFLPMGDMKNLTRCFEQTFTAYNKGPLNAFVSVSVENNRPDQRCFATSVSVTPNRLVLPPSSNAKFRVQFRPQRDELKKLMKMHKTSDVLLIANLIVFMGDEPTRHRVRKLIRETPNHALNSSAGLSDLWGVFPREERDEQLSELREHANALVDLTHGFRTVEIALTMNNGADDTLMNASGWDADFEETILFTTITSGEVPMRDEVEVLTVQPQKIFLEAIEKYSKRITLTSLTDETMLFEMECDQPEVVEFLPNSGELMARETDSIHVRFKLTPMTKKFFVIRIKTSQQVISVPVYVVV
ncbi:uncharacterized protein LOC132260882 [Phlebotomus argentipes]|uniref:uncharacterized protein LOC132260882 n=1 Tax=Phlebotomus argentipes TaxID=94469 RepID=UPI002892F655|nr:uncharacterized protein LOC132260882 [Phlebotomus argentipes]